MATTVKKVHNVDEFLQVQDLEVTGRLIGPQFSRIYSAIDALASRNETVTLGNSVIRGLDPIPAGTELFDLSQPDCVSSLGRRTYSRLLCYFPAVGHDEIGTEFDSPWTKFSGHGVLGSFVGTTNLVQSPEDWTDSSYWTTSSATIALSSYYFQGRRFSLLTAAGSSSGCIMQSFAASTLGAAGAKSTSVTIKKGSGNARVGMYDVGVGWIFLAQVAWSTKTVSFTAGSATIAHQKWWGDDIVELSFIWTLTTSTHEHRLYAYGGTADGHYNYYTAAQVESVPHPTPYTPTGREAGNVSWKIDATLTGTVEFWYCPWFNYNTGANRYIWLWGASASGLSNSVWLRYLQSGDNFEALIYVDGSNYRRVAGSTIANNAALWKWWHFKIIWDIPNQSIRMWIDGTEQTTTSSAGTVSGMTPQQDLMQVGYSASAGASASDGLYADLLLRPGTITDTTTTHYTAAVPWYDPTEVTNKYRSVRINRYGIRLHNAQLALTDDWNRSIEISPATGMLARDAAGKILHDIPTAALAQASYAMGHFYEFEEDTAAYTILDDSTPTIGSWETGLQAVSGGHSNVKGVRLKVYVNGTGAAGMADTRLIMRPTGSAWSSSILDMPVADCITFTLSSGTFSSATRVAIMDVPVTSALQFDYYLILYPSSSTTRLVIQQLGVWI